MKMSKVCVVANCDSGLEPSERPIYFFLAPKDPELREKWDNAIPEKREPLDFNSWVCEKHFLESDLIRYYVKEDAAGHVVEKVIYEHPKLTDTAVPTIFSGYEFAPNKYPERTKRPANQVDSSDTLTDVLFNVATNVTELEQGGGYEATNVTKLASHNASCVAQTATSPAVKTNIEGIPLLNRDASDIDPTPGAPTLQANLTSTVVDPSKLDDRSVIAKEPTSMGTSDSTSMSSVVKCGNGDGCDAGCCDDCEYDCCCGLLDMDLGTDGYDCGYGDNVDDGGGD